MIRYTDHFDEDGPLIYRHACDMGLEGIVSKRRNAPYRSGRSENFVKTKCHGRQEFIVAGFTPSTAMPRAIGALTVAAHENGELRYAGRIGTGYTQKTARDLWKRLEPLRTDRRPIELPADERRKDVIWVNPKLVVEAEFAGVTHGGVLRQASFKGLREDKIAREVVREMPAGKTPPPATKKSAATRSSPGKAVRATAGGKRRQGNGNSAGAALALTHPDRVYWPESGVTKKELAEYYVDVWDWIKPHILGRALSLVRAPEGITGETFFQKHIAANAVGVNDRNPAAAAPAASERGMPTQAADPIKASSSFPAARASMSWCRSRAPAGTRPSCSPSGSPRRWPRIVRSFISPR